MARGIPTTVLVAPDSFKGTFTATEVAAAVGRGLEAGGWPVDRCPVADGGEGTLAALGSVLGLEPHEVEVTDPLGRPVRATFGLGQSGRGGERTALVEMAAANGLGLVAPAERDVWAASTAGTGELIGAAVAAGATRVLVAAGGSATVDGGAGALEALGRLPDGVRIVVLCDVSTPWERAAATFGPQKGADPAMVERLAARLDALAPTLPRDPRGVTSSGAAGGLAGGLWAAGAELVAGAGFVLEALGFDARMRAARAVVVGEGRIDRQTLAGKICGEIATRSRQAGVPCHAVVGAHALDRFDQRILDIGLILEASTLAELEAAGAELAVRL